MSRVRPAEKRARPVASSVPTTEVSEPGELRRQLRGLEAVLREVYGLHPQLRLAAARPRDRSFPARASRRAASSRVARRSKPSADSRGSTRPSSAKPGARGVACACPRPRAPRSARRAAQGSSSFASSSKPRAAIPSVGARSSPPLASSCERSQRAVVAELRAQPRLRRAALEAQRVRAFAERQREGPRRERDEDLRACDLELGAERERAGREREPEARARREIQPDRGPARDRVSPAPASSSLAVASASAWWATRSARACDPPFASPARSPRASTARGPCTVAISARASSITSWFEGSAGSRSPAGAGVASLALGLLRRRARAPRAHRSAGPAAPISPASRIPETRSAPTRPRQRSRSV